MKGILSTALSLVTILLIIVVTYGIVTGKPIIGSVQARLERMEPVQEKIKEVGPEKLEQARQDPRGTFIQAKDENLPAFLAFLDLDTSVTDAAVAEYRALLDKLVKYYGDTPKDVVQAVFTIQEASLYYPELTYLQCLQYLNDTIVPDAAAKPAEAGNVRQAGEQIHGMLVMRYFEPMRQQQAAQAEYQARVDASINQNLAAAQARGQARNELRNQDVAARNNLRMQHLNWSYGEYVNHLNGNNTGWNRY